MTLWRVKEFKQRPALVILLLANSAAGSRRQGVGAVVGNEQTNRVDEARRHELGEAIAHLPNGNHLSTSRPCFFGVWFGGVGLAVEVEAERLEDLRIRVTRRLAARREVSEMPLLGRPVFIREDRETEARFDATPVPGKIGMAMAGQGLNTAPPPRPASLNYFGTQANPGNQLYVGNGAGAAYGGGGGGFEHGAGAAGSARGEASCPVSVLAAMRRGMSQYDERAGSSVLAAMRRSEAHTDGEEERGVGGTGSARGGIQVPVLAAMLRGMS
ncbi:hypothetical protein DFH09DRAFT_1287258 [Mycena vulgaris]|nr:hypothetical protein DFH09DRAFT_1287258 [Mycena vulgaris]